MIDNILLWLVALIIVPAPIIYLISRENGKSTGWIVFAILALATIISGMLMPLVETHNILEEYSWTLAPVQLTFGLLADGLSTPVLFTFMFVFAFVALFSMPYMERRFNLDDIENSNNNYAIFYTALLIYAGSIAGSVLSTNMIEYYLFFEIALVFSWLLVFMFGYGNRQKNSLIYFLYTHIGGGTLLIGILAASWAIGSFEMIDLWLISGMENAFWIGIAITLGLLVKIGALGLHGWMPITYSESPAPVSAVLGATSVLLSTYTFSRLIPPFKDVLFGVSGYIELWALITILYAGIMALRQKDTKKLVAYLSMSQMNYCVLGVFTFQEFGILGAISYSISHGLAIALLFLVAGAILYRTETRDMSKLGGLAEKLPVAIIASIVGFLTIGGVPPAVGFKSKFILLAGAFERGFIDSGLELAVAILAGSLATIITIAYEFKSVWNVYYGKLPETFNEVKRVPSKMAVTLLALAALSIIFGLWPSLITNPIEAFILNLFKGLHT